MGKAGKSIAFGTAFAVAAGYVAGVLTAPKSGKQTRTDLKNAATENITQAEKRLKKLHTQLAGLLVEANTQAEGAKGKARTEMNGVIDKAKTVREKARELLSAVHEGDAEDKELKLAIANTAKAVEDLKTYLKKPATPAS